MNFISHKKTNIILSGIIIICALSLYSFIFNTDRDVIKQSENSSLNTNVGDIPSVRSKPPSPLVANYTDIDDNLSSEPEYPSDMSSSTNLNVIFKDSIINENTISTVDTIRTKFSSSLDDFELHYSQVEAYINTQMNDASKAKEFLNFYIKYTNFENDLAFNPPSLWQENPENPEEAILLNNEKHNRKCDVFGKDVADKLWGNELKEYEYKMKELEILHDDSYTAHEKERLIENLKTDLLEISSDNNDENQNETLPRHDQLYIKLALYGNDLMSMTEDERNYKIREFRYEIYPSEVVKQMEILDKGYRSFPR